jgi:tRNA A37 N6-isopentenylltransferase MiaA
MTREATSLLQRVFFIVGPTACGKSQLAADVASEAGAEIVSADAYQIYAGFPLLTAKPDVATLGRSRHHLIGSVPILQEMNAERFRRAATAAIEEIHARGKSVIVTGGSGLYIKALTHGLHSDWKKSEVNLPGVFVFRDRAELHARIRHRVEEMFARGAIDEVGGAGAMSATAAKMIGLREIGEMLERKISREEAKERIAAATRQYAKRQLTWFRHQTTFPALNLSQLSHGEAVTRILQLRALSELAEQG